MEYGGLEDDEKNGFEESPEFYAYDFQKIPPVNSQGAIVENAFNAMKQKRSALLKRKYKTPESKQKNIAKESVKAFSKSIKKQLANIHKGFPFIDKIDPVNRKLLELDYSPSEIRKNIGAIMWAERQIAKIEREYGRKLNGAFESSEYDRIKNSFIGRATSVLSQVEKSFVFLEKFRKYLKEMPVIKRNLKIIAIAGFPNVGKSTLLSKLTKAKPEINVYPFTTKGLNLGNMSIGSFKFQVIDAPGTLNRTGKMNNIERKAHIIMNDAADIIIYVFDPSLNYPLEQQEKLYERILKENEGKKILPYISKTDIVKDYKKIIPERIVSKASVNGKQLCDKLKGTMGLKEQFRE